MEQTSTGKVEPSSTKKPNTMKSTKVQTLGADFIGRGRAKELLRVREALTRYNEHVTESIWKTTKAKALHKLYG